MHTLLKAHHYKSFLSCTDPEYSHPVGGVATLARAKLKILKLQPVTPEFQTAQLNGRVQITGIVMPSNILLIVVNIYSWTNGHTCSQAAQRTDD
eukprot:9190381-Karenia_brevis.AAC.1